MWRLIVLIAAVSPITNHHHLICHDFDTRVFYTFFVVPATGLQASFNVNLLTLVEILFANFCQVAPGNNIEPFCLVVALTVAGIPLTTDSYSEGRDRAPGGRISHF